MRNGLKKTCLDEGIKVGESILEEIPLVTPTLQVAKSAYTIYNKKRAYDFFDFVEKNCTLPPCDSNKYDKFIASLNTVYLEFVTERIKWKRDYMKKIFKVFCSEDLKDDFPLERAINVLKLISRNALVALKKILEFELNEKKVPVSIKILRESLTQSSDILIDDAITELVSLGLIQTIDNQIVGGHEKICISNVFSHKFIYFVTEIREYKKVKPMSMIY